jgi:hypothetical protein
LNETLGLIRGYGISHDRALARSTIGYYLESLDESERHAVENEKVVQDLLTRTERHEQGYVLGMKSQAMQPKNEAPILDQGLIDSLLANDSYNWLVRKALEAGMEVKRIQAEKAHLLEQSKDLEKNGNLDRAASTLGEDRIRESLAKLEPAYRELMSNVLATVSDFERRELNGSIRLADEVRTEGTVKALFTASGLGMLIGLAAGAGLSLIDVTISGRRKLRAPHTDSPDFSDRH